MPFEVPLWGAVLLFLLGMGLLIKGGDWFVDGAVGVAHKFHIPELLIGATVVSIGTTLPEVMVSAMDAIEAAKGATGQGGIAYGNAIGSVICNTALIAAITLAIRPGKLERKSLLLPVCFFFGAALLYAGVAYIGGFFSRIVGIILLVLFVAYMTVSVISAVKTPKEEQAGDEEEMKTGKAVFLLILGAAVIAFGARLLVDYGTQIAAAMGVPQSVIGLTVVALGTSLPELITAIISLVKGYSSLSLGNVIGANLFNLVLVSGVAVTIKPFSIAGFASSLRVDLPLMLGVSAVMCLPAVIKGKTYRWQGILLLLSYAAFCVYQFAFAA